MAKTSNRCLISFDMINKGVCGRGSSETVKHTARDERYVLWVTTELQRMPNGGNFKQKITVLPIATVLFNITGIAATNDALFAFSFRPVRGRSAKNAATRRPPSPTIGSEQKLRAAPAINLGIRLAANVNHPAYSIVIHWTRYLVHECPCEMFQRLTSCLTT